MTTSARPGAGSFGSRGQRLPLFDRYADMMDPVLRPGTQHRGELGALSLKPRRPTGVVINHRDAHGNHPDILSARSQRLAGVASTLQTGSSPSGYFDL
jgi:hypothetical protein